MKFKDKYPDMKPGDTETKQDFIMRCSSPPSQCFTCLEPTEFIDVASEARFCSEECLRNFRASLKPN